MITDEMIAEAAAELNEVMIHSLPEPADCRHPFSRKFERKMEKLIHRVNHPIRYMVLNRVASILLVILIGFTMVMSFSPTARAAVYGWVRETYKSFYEYYSETDVETESNYRYQIDPVPDGYTEVSYTDNDGLHMYVFTDDQNKMMIFVYCDETDGAHFFIGKEGYSVEEISVAGNPADLYLTDDSDKTNGIIWCNDESGLIFYISGEFDGEELIKLAESVKKCPHS